MPSKGSLPDRQKAMKERIAEKKRKKFSSYDILKSTVRSISKRRVI